MPDADEVVAGGGCAWRLPQLDTGSAAGEDKGEENSRSTTHPLSEKTFIHTYSYIYTCIPTYILKAKHKDIHRDR